MQWRRPVLVVLMAATAVTVARSGHELPVYPSYYPHEIEIARVAPDRAAALLTDGKLHAYVGSAPRFDGAPPDTLQSVESLGSFITARINPASPHARDESATCAAMGAVARDIAARNRDVILHAYPVTPLHGDYLHHVDLAENAKAALATKASAVQDLKLRATPMAQRLLPGDRTPDAAWDVSIQEVSLAQLIAASTTAMNGWLGPPELRSGWYQAYWLLDGLVLGGPRAHAEAGFKQLQANGFADAAQRINAERAFVAALTAGCRELVIGYTLKREYFNAEFSAGVENVGFDAFEGFNSPIFLRTVKLKDFPWNGWLQLGIDARPAAAWNPIGGFTDPFGRLLWSALADPIAIPSPYESAWMLNRASDVQVRGGR